MWITFTIFFKIHITIIVNRCNLNGLFNDKLSSALNLVFIKSLLYSHFSTELHSPPFIVLISFLIPSQCSVYFFNTSLFHLWSQKLNIYFHYFLWYAHLLYQLSDTKDYAVNTFLMTNFFNCDISNISKYQYLCTIFCLFLVSMNQIVQY